MIKLSTAHSQGASYFFKRIDSHPYLIIDFIWIIMWIINNIPEVSDENYSNDN